MFHQRCSSESHVYAEDLLLWCASDGLETWQTAVVEVNPFAAEVRSPDNKSECSLLGAERSVQEEGYILVLHNIDLIMCL